MIADPLVRLTRRRAAIDQQWRDEIRRQITAGASLRSVAARAGISHTAVKFIAHGRPENP